MARVMERPFVFRPTAHREGKVAEMTERRTKLDEQGRKFVEAARALGCDVSEERFDAALKKIADQKPSKSPDGVIRATWDRPPSYPDDDAESSA
jgi:hypothetical protein